ncbi:hypothetical protein ABZP36_004706 [Zizania latifolia]
MTWPSCRYRFGPRRPEMGRPPSGYRAGAWLGAAAARPRRAEERASEPSLRESPLMEPAAIRRAAPSLSAAARPLLRLPLRGFASISFPSFSGGGGSRFVGGGGGGGGGGGRGGGDSGAGAAAAASAAVAALGKTETADADVILLHVGGMSCGGCAANVKRILESQPEITSATVDFEGKTATVWTTPEAKAIKDWQKQLGEKLAHHLSTCGFQSHLLGKGLHFNLKF